MEMQHNIIVAKDHNGVVGLMIEGTQDNEKLDSCQIPLLIAHDCVEHMNGLEALGTATDEFQALGAIQYGRGYGSAVRLWGDVQNTWRYMNQHEETLEDVGEIDCEERGFFEQEVHRAWEDRDDENTPKMGAKAKRLTVNLMCLGFKKANDRFGCRLSAYDAYTRVEAEFLNWMKPYANRYHAGPRWMPDLRLDDVEGLRLKLTYDTEGQSAHLEEIHV